MQKIARYPGMEMTDEFHELEYDHHRLEAGRGVLEQSVRQLRSFARWVSGCRVESDALVEDTLTLYLAQDRSLNEPAACFSDLLNVFRRVHVRPAANANYLEAPVDSLADLLSLSLPEREVAALSLGLGVGPEESAELLQQSLADVKDRLETVRARIGDGAELPDWLFPGAGRL